MMFLLQRNGTLRKFNFALLLLLRGIAYGQSIDSIKFSFQDLPANIQNPLTGFFPYAKGPTESRVPASLEYLPVPLNSVVQGPNRYIWTDFELKLSETYNRNRQCVVRFYLDFPGLPTGIPQYLLASGLGTTRYRVNGNCATCSLLPDYSNQRLRTCLVNFVKEFASRYNGDRRIGIVQVGLIGFWGEWHTWPLKYTRQTFPDTPFLDAILRTYHDGFNSTLLQVGINIAALDIFNSYANASQVKQLRIGYSDDSIYSSYYDGFIRPNLERSNTTLRYLTSIIGGEVFPPVQNCIFRSPSCVGNEDELLRIAKVYKSSTLLFQQAFTGLKDVETEKVIRLSRALGYRYHIDFVNVFMFNNRTTFEVSVKNTGTAIPYFKLSLGLDIAHVCYIVSNNLAEVLPDKDRLYSLDVPYVATRNVYRGRFFLNALTKVLPSQTVYLSNANINGDGDLYFSINPRSAVALPWVKLEQE